MRLWIITELFYPDEIYTTAYILTKMANRLTEKYEVHVICGPAMTKADKLRLDPRVVLHRTHFGNFSKNRTMTRIFRFVVLTSVLFFNASCLIRRGDKVLMPTNPAPLILTIPVLKAFKKINLTLLVHDVFPENTIPGNYIHSSRSLLFRISKKAFDWAYSKADKIIVLGRDMEDVIRKKIAPYHFAGLMTNIPNWADLDDIQPKAFPESDSKVVLQYAGNLGRVQGLISLFQIIRQTNNVDLLVDVWGGGAIENDINSYVHYYHLDNIHLHGVYQREQQSAIISSCHLSIVTLASGMYGLGVPSKSYNIMAVGRAILFIGPIDSEIALLVKENKLGFVFDNNDTEGLLKFLNQLNPSMLPELKEMGQRAKQLAHEQYGPKEILDKFAEFV